LIRSLLYVPAHAERFVAKAHEREADAIILDLEDAVPPGEKSNARAALVDAVPAVSRNRALVFVRINAGDDADAEAACRAGAFGLLTPKARAPETLRKLAALLDQLERETGRKPMHLVPMIEDPSAVFDARAIGAATPRVLALMTGGEDMATALGAEPTPEALRFPTR
jgi:citrate lyase subunit beta/citryl-CoA lyase